ncbi:MAG: sensor histidine kinase [Sulfuricellaceae bacterium]|jgi:signal transduction histidine kinase
MTQVSDMPVQELHAAGQRHVPPLATTPLAQLLDLANLQQLTLSFSEATGVSSAIIDLEGKVLAASRWQRLCTDYHRSNSATCARCIESDTDLALRMRKGEDWAIYDCRNGLTDAAAPIVIGGRHVANVFVGQFLRAAPDEDFFRRQVREFGFDEDGYFQALHEVPIIPGEKLPAILDFMKGFAQLISSLGNTRLNLQREAEKNIEQERLLIQQSRLAAMGEMVHNIAHQWRQPLNALSIIISNIKDDYDFKALTPETLEKAVNHSRRLLQQMSSTIDDFRDFFRPDREPGEFDVAQAIDDALFIMDASLKHNNISVEKQYAPGLVVYGYANQFAQAVLNIIANAKEALQGQNRPDRMIRIRLERADGHAILTIQDNGGGVPMAILPRIFEPYFTTKELGSGIGLYMTKTIIERNLHGTISAANHEHGLLITIVLPLLQQEIEK